MLCMSVLSIPIIFVYDLVLKLILFLVLFSLSRALPKVPKGVPSRVHVISISFNRKSYTLYINDSAQKLCARCCTTSHCTTNDCTALGSLWRRIISSGFRTALPPRSPDLNPCDFWLWGFLKDYVYRRNIQTDLELKESILSHVSSIDRETLRAAVEHVATRFEHVIDTNGMHFEQIYD